MRRVVVIGGTGFFGGTLVGELAAAGVPALTAGRRPSADLHLDAEEPGSLRAALRRRDVVVDAAGPFQRRSPALVEVAMTQGFDVVDLSDSLDHAAALNELAPAIAAAGIRVLSGCSAVSAVVAALVRSSGVAVPRRVSAFLAPASRETAHRATISAFFASVAVPIRTRRHGRLTALRGWSVSRVFPGVGRAFLVEGALSVTLPRVWPSLETADLWVTTHVRGADRLLGLIARAPALRHLLHIATRLGPTVGRMLGSRRGTFGAEIESPDGSLTVRLLTATRGSHFVALAPALLTTRALATDSFVGSGLVPADTQVDPQVLFDELARHGIELRSERGAGSAGPHSFDDADRPDAE